MFRGIIITLILVFVVAFGYQNLAKVPLSLVFGNPVKISLTFLIGISFSVGLLTSVITGAIIKIRNEKSEL